MTKIAMWSGPRNISTAIMRSFGNRPDTFITDEPFYSYYLNKTQQKHPMYKEIISSGEIIWEKIVEHISGDIPKNKSVWYQKHMAQHNLPGMDLGWIYNMNNVVLIRHPKKVILSYIKKFEIENINQLGYVQQFDLINLLKDKNNQYPVIIDAEDLLKNPKEILCQLCKKIGIPFYNNMLSWKYGEKNTDGIWGKYWYKKVNDSNSFLKSQTSTLKMPEKYLDIYNNCLHYYKKMYNTRLI